MKVGQKKLVASTGFAAFKADSVHILNRVSKMNYL